MPCTRCKGTCVNDHFYTRVDEQGQWRLGAWRWALRCSACGKMVDERTGGVAAGTVVPIDRTNSMPLLRMI